VLGRLAIRVAPYSANPYGIEGDALLELGRYPQAFAAFQKMVDLKPNLSSYARVSYARELSGDLPGAITAMRMALDAAAGDREGYAWTAVQLGSPMSMIFSDDVEMLERCQQGLARDVGPWIDFSRGLGMDRHGPDGSISGAASEMPMRVQFEAWVNHLTAEAA
jgi:tetratricopeptide (TPR) repeat protein